MYIIYILHIYVFIIKTVQTNLTSKLGKSIKYIYILKKIRRDIQHGN